MYSQGQNVQVTTVFGEIVGKDDRRRSLRLELREILSPLAENSFPRISGRNDIECSSYSDYYPFKAFNDYFVL